MGTHVRRLARWARDLTWEALPPSVQARARLQHLSAAGSVKALAGRDVARTLRRAGPSRGSARLVTGGSSTRAAAVRLHAGLGTWLDTDDHLLFGNTSASATAAAWAAAKGHTVGELLTATVAANEVAGRIGASMFFGPSPAGVQATVHAAASAVSLGLLEGLDADALAHALALSLAMPHRVPQRTWLGGGLPKALIAGQPAAAAVDAVALARDGARGPLDILDDRDGLLGALSWVPLRAAFTGLGQAWLTETLAFGLMPAHPVNAPTVQAVHEILMRHVRAADKRLRVNQVDKIELDVAAPAFSLAAMRARHTGHSPAAIPACLKTSIGALVADHELGVEQLEAASLARRRDAIADVAAKVEVRHDWARTLDLVEHAVDVLQPLLAGVTSSELRTVAMRASGVYSGLPVGASEVITLLRRRPGRLLERIRYASGNLADARLDQWQYRYGCEVRVYTTRGGSWPERRDVAWGSPGWPWADTQDRVLQKFAGSVEREAVAAAASLRDTEVGDEAPGFVDALLSG